MVSLPPCVPNRARAGPPAEWGGIAGGMGGFCFRGQSPSSGQAGMLKPQLVHVPRDLKRASHLSVLQCLRLSKCQFHKVQARSHRKCSVRPHAHTVGLRASVPSLPTDVCLDARLMPRNTGLRPGLIRKGKAGQTLEGSKRI